MGRPRPVANSAPRESSPVNGYRRIRHARRPACGPSATYRAERYEEQIALLFDRVTLDESDIRQVLRAMRSTTAQPAEPDSSELQAAQERLQQQLSSGEITITVFTRGWRKLERPERAMPSGPDELRLGRARRLLAGFGTLWRNPAVPDRLREEAIREIFERFDVDGPEIVAVHPQANENAWLLGLVAVRQEQLRTQPVMGVVGPPVVSGWESCSTPCRPSGLHPRLAREWHPTRTELRPDQVSRAAAREVVWRCESGHEWSAAVYQRTLSGSGCPTCYRLEAIARSRAGKARARREKDEAETAKIIRLGDRLSGGEIG